MSRSRRRGPRIHVAVVQTEPRFGEVERNVGDALRLVERLVAREGRADLVVLPELFHTGYLFRSRAEARAYAEDARRGPTIQALLEFCRSHETHVVAGLCERNGDRLHNSAVWVGPRGVGGVYRKVHLFDREKLHFEPGREPWPVFRAGEARVGVMICFDWRFPEAARALALAGADLIAHPSNLVLPYCQEAMRTRALENRVWCVTANRVGADRRGRGLALGFTGRSQVTAPDGAVAARLGPRRAGARRVAIDLGAARDKRVTERNDLFTDRTPTLYRGLAEGGRPSAVRSRGSRRRR